MTQRYSGERIFQVPPPKLAARTFILGEPATLFPRAWNAFPLEETESSAPLRSELFQLMYNSLFGMLKLRVQLKKRFSAFFHPQNDLYECAPGFFVLKLRMMRQTVEVGKNNLTLYTLCKKILKN